MTGNSNKSQFAKPSAAQRAAALLGTSLEELSRSIFSTGGVTTLSRTASLRYDHSSYYNVVSVREEGGHILDAVLAS